MNLASTRKYNQSLHKELLRIYKVLLLLNNHGDPQFLFQNFNNQ